jgi:hypothetical protein
VFVAKAEFIGDDPIHVAYLDSPAELTAIAIPRLPSATETSAGLIELLGHAPPNPLTEHFTTIAGKRFRHGSTVDLWVYGKRTGASYLSVPVVPWTESKAATRFDLRDSGDQAAALTFQVDVTDLSNRSVDLGIMYLERPGPPRRLSIPICAGDSHPVPAGTPMSLSFTGWPIAWAGLDGSVSCAGLPEQDERHSVVVPTTLRRVNITFERGGRRVRPAAEFVGFCYIGHVRDHRGKLLGFGSPPRVVDCGGTVDCELPTGAARLRAFSVDGQQEWTWDSTIDAGPGPLHLPLDFATARVRAKAR